MSKNKTRTKDKYRVVYNDTQRIELENEFRLNEYIAIPRKQEIASKLQLSERQIKIWFQNRRAKKRKQQKRQVTSTRPNPSSDNSASSAGFELGPVPATTDVAATEKSPASIDKKSLAEPLHHHHLQHQHLQQQQHQHMQQIQQIQQQQQHTHQLCHHNQMAPVVTAAQQAVGATQHYYEPVENYPEDQDQVVEGAASISVSQPRPAFGASWPIATVTTVAQPHQMVAVSPQLTSPQLTTTSPPSSTLTSQNFHQQHQQSVSPYSHHNHLTHNNNHHHHNHHHNHHFHHHQATNYSTAAVAAVAASAANQPMHQHFLNQQQHQQHQHQHQQDTQVPSMVPHHYQPLHPQHMHNHHQHYQQTPTPQQHFYSQQPTAY